VNVHDLWQAFYGVFETEEAGGCDDRVVMSLFYRIEVAGCLAETFAMVTSDEESR
jgi:hypothetical protein